MSAVLGRVLPADPASRAAALSVCLQAVLMVLKLSVGVISGSVAVISDGVDSLEDLIAAAIALASVRYGAKPPDREHPYGHGRAETLAAGIQAMLIGVGGVLILIGSVQRIVDPPDSIDVNVAIVVMLIAAAANLILVQYTGRVGRETGSPAIRSETRHLWTNVVQAGAVSLGLVAVAITGEVAIDGVIAFGLGCYLLWIAGNILWMAVGDVLDTSLPDDELAQIRAVIETESGRPDAFHLLRTRRAGQVRHIDFHMMVPGDMSVQEAHDTADRIEARIEKLWQGTVVTVHAEPEEEPHEHSGAI
jgi:cation diffusion facilitator family transporter